MGSRIPIPCIVLAARIIRRQGHALRAAGVLMSEEVAMAAADAPTIARQADEIAQLGRRLRASAECERIAVEAYQQQQQSSQRELKVLYHATEQQLLDIRATVALAASALPEQPDVAAKILALIIEGTNA